MKQASTQVATVLAWPLSTKFVSYELIVSFRAETCGPDVFFFFVLSGSYLRVELVFMFILSRIVILSFACIRIVLTHLLVVTIFSALALPEWTKSSFCFSAEHYLKSVQIRSIF